MRMQNNYDNIATAYDFLSRLVFGKAQVNVQLDLLTHITPDSRILIVGGGSGWILEELTKLYPEGLSITYVEISLKMLNRSKKRHYGANKVNFIHGAIESYIEKSLFDVVITSFLFDNFSEQRVLQVFDLLDKKLLASGLWLFADFSVDEESGKLWKKIILELMYKFFGLICNVEAKKLVNMEVYFNNFSYLAIANYTRYLGFIKGAVYKRNT